MEPLPLPPGLPEHAGPHLANVAENLQLLADLGYGDVALAVPEGEGSLVVVADARPTTAVAAVASPRVGKVLPRQDEPEAYAALESGEAVRGERRRSTRGISYATSAHPIGLPPFGVVVRDVTEQVAEAPGKMEKVFMSLADGLLSRLAEGPLADVATGGPFSTTRRAGDGVLRVGSDGAIAYASPNAVNILRVAGAHEPVTGTPASRLPGAAVGIMPALQAGEAVAAEVKAGGRVLRYRTVVLPGGALVLVEDMTDARRREQELKVKEATIREVHHRVKNNLQTIASLLRIQERRTDSEEATRALHEAVERISSMAVVHEMLSGSTEERVDFAAAARTVVDMVRQGLTGADAQVDVAVEGTMGEVSAQVATSLALVTAELVHNAIEHGLAGGHGGKVTVSLRRVPGEAHLVVRDDGAGLPPGFDLRRSANLGLAIVRTVVEDDLRGTLDVGGAPSRGTTVTIHVPIDPEGRAV